MGRRAAVRTKLTKFPFDATINGENCVVARDGKKITFTYPDSPNSEKGNHDLEAQEALRDAQA